MKDQEIIVSIIVSCYNYGRYISDALSSVREQTFSKWECIVVNDGSTDDSRQVIESFIRDDPRFTLINIGNSGVCVARNTGVAHSKGRYLFPLDADNKLHPQCISRCLAEFENKPGTRLVYTEAQLFGVETRLWDLPDFDYRTMLKYNMVDNSALFLRKEFDRVGGYRTNMVHGLEDWDFFIALLYGCTNDQVIKIKEPLFYYRVKERSRGIAVVKDSHFEKMTDYIILNNFEIYREYFPDIFTRIHAYDFNNRMLHKKPVKWLSTILIWLAKFRFGNNK